MSADELRRAASLMRERAEAATPGPWEVLWNAVAYVDTVADPSDPTGQTPMQSPEKVADAASRDREHIAAADPPFMLAVADWLDAEAEVCVNDDAEQNEPASTWAVRDEAAVVGDLGCERPDDDRPTATVRAAIRTGLPGLRPCPACRCSHPRGDRWCPIAWWCPRCKTGHRDGSPEDGCPDCGSHVEVRP